MTILDVSTPDQIRIKIDQKSVEGEMATSLKKLCQDKLQEKMQDIHFDLSEVKFFDSGTIGTLLFLIQLLKKNGRKVFIESCTPELRDLFSSILLDQFVEFGTQA